MTYFQRQKRFEEELAIFSKGIPQRLGAADLHVG